MSNIMAAAAILHHGIVPATGIIAGLLGLVALLPISSQVQRLLSFFKHRKTAPHPHAAAPQGRVTAEPIDIFNDPAAAAKDYRSISACLGDRFFLNRLYDLFKQENVIHPHLTIRTLRESGHLVKSEDGLFFWKTE